MDETGPVDPPLILIVDDEPDLLKLVEFSCRPLKARLETFPSGLDLLKRLRQGPFPDLILLDVMMPVLNGFDTCRQLRELPGLEMTKVAFLTAKTSDRDYHEGILVGGDYFIEKPFDVDVLPVKVRGFLGGDGKA